MISSDHSRRGMHIQGILLECGDESPLSFAAEPLWLLIRHEVNELRPLPFPFLLFCNYNTTFRSLSAFPTTDSELRLIATLAQTGDINNPKTGYSNPAAMGTLAAL